MKTIINRIRQFFRRLAGKPVSGPTAVTGPTEVKTEKLYEVSFWYSNGTMDDLYECEEVLATDEDDAIEAIRSGLKDELGYAHFVIDKIKLLYDNPLKL